MRETRPYDGPNWRDNPDEYKPPMRRGGSFLASRSYENPEIATGEDIQRVITRLDAPIQAEVAAQARAEDVSCPRRTYPRP